jgi:ankyrin repeat protein
LLNAGADASLSDNNGITPFILAISEGHTEIADMLEAE